MSRIMIFPIETIVTVMATAETIFPLIEYLATPIAGPISVLVEDIILTGVPFVGTDLPIENTMPTGEETIDFEAELTPYRPYLVPYLPVFNDEQRVALMTTMPDRDDYFNG